MTASRICVALSAAKGQLIENRRGQFTTLRWIEATAPAVFADLENRGYQDLVTSGAVFRNEGKGELKRAAGRRLEPSLMAAADFNGRRARGPRRDRQRRRTTRLTKIRRSPHNNWLRIGISGVKNLKLAPGATVEVKTGASYQKQIYQGVPLAIRPGRVQRGRHGAHHLAQRPDPERDQAADPDRAELSRKRSGFPARAR